MKHYNIVHLAQVCLLDATELNIQKQVLLIQGVVMTVLALLLK